MKLSELVGLVSEVHAVGRDCRDAQRLSSGLANIRRLRGWMDSREASMAAQLADLSAFPEQAVAEPTRSSQRDAKRVLDRHHTAAKMPELAKAFNDGLVRGEHLDVVVRATGPLTPPNANGSPGGPNTWLRWPPSRPQTSSLSRCAARSPASKPTTAVADWNANDAPAGYAPGWNETPACGDSPGRSTPRPG
jgi:hypothetical protein